MDEPVIEPQNVNKDPQLIKDAQTDIGKLDLLVCGECHDVFYFVEEFQEHKSPGKCTGTSSIRDNFSHEPKSQVWAFMLWKNAQFKQDKDLKERTSSWSVYQKWCKLDIAERETWIVAGRNIQSFTKLGTAKMQELRVKSQSNKHNDTQDSLEEGEIPISQLSESQKSKLATSDKSKEGNSLDGNANSDSDDEAEGVKGSDDKKAANSVQSISEVKKVPLSRKGTRTIKEKNTTEECTVENIVSRRYNPRKRTFEYLVKWEEYDSDHNTWEAPPNIINCKILMDEFDKNLQIMRAQKTNRPAILQKRLEKAKEHILENVELTSRGRPQRTSKKKALNQVKVWCGDISDVDELPGKRRFPDDDSDSDSFEKKIKLDSESDESEEEKPSVTIKKIIKPVNNSLNGVGVKKPDNLLWLNSKQISSLSSGVYIMNKNKELIKLDSNSANIPNRTTTQSGVSLLPKIGETRIKIIRKEDGQGSNLMRISPKGMITKIKPAVKTTPLKATPNIILKSGNQSNGTTTITKVVVKEHKPAVKPHSDDEESDGLEELEFPTDLPLPEPESPPGDFTLDPLTGKLVGHEYPEEKKNEVKEELPKESTLEDLVKMTTSDDTIDIEPIKLEAEDSIKNEETPHEVEQAVAVLTDEMVAVTPVTTAAPEEAIAVTTAASVVTTATSPESASVSFEKKLLSVPTTVRQKIMAQNADMKPMPVTKPPHRNRLLGTRGRLPLSGAPIISRIPPKNTYSNKSKLMQPKLTPPPVQSPPVILNSEIKTSVPSTSGAVISMPLLTGDDDPATDTKVDIKTETEEGEAPTIAIPQSEAPLFLTGEDGTLYQIAGQNEQGQTVLISQGADGQQQCLVVASENTTDVNQVVSLEGAISESDTAIQEPLLIQTEGEAEAQTENGDTQVDAQIVRAEPPSPGGTRRVLLMLPDGNMMMTELSPDQYNSLELDK